MSKTFDRIAEKEMKGSIISDSHIITKTLEKEDLLKSEKLNESSSDFEREDDDEFERASSN